MLNRERHSYLSEPLLMKFTQQMFMRTAKDTHALLRRSIHHQPPLPLLPSRWPLTLNGFQLER